MNAGIHGSRITPSACPGRQLRDQEDEMSRYRITVDTGGTFSDFVYLDEDTGLVSITKVASTPDDPSRAILQGIEALVAQGVRAADIGFFCHGTTVGTNALLEGNGVKTGLLVTEGFRGVYEVAEQARPYGPAIFDVLYDKPAMLVSASLTGEVAERVDFSGTVLKPLDENALRQTVLTLRSRGIESLAVCLLFSFLHPAHEARLREIVAEVAPEVSISLSSEVLPQIREYYRLSTTVINAYLQPILARYIAQLDRRLSQASVTTRQKYIMQSNGGMSTFDAAARRAVTTVLSGPAGGVTAGAYACRMTGVANIITFDMGGTSCDVALIKDGEPGMASRGKIEGRDLAVPMMDINTVSAGGGTIAKVDRFGALEVGPHSAGAVPGPACYGRGGTEPTITDCNLVLGLLSADNFLGGTMRLDAGKARQAIDERIAQPLGIDTTAAAEGVIRIIDVKMEEAIKAISTMCGHDLRDFHLLAFGGAGPLHAGRIARDLGMAGIIVPLYPGVYSAIGLLMSDVKHDYVQSRMTQLRGLDPAAVNAMFDRLVALARDELHDDGFAADRISVQRALDMRYAGQGYEMTLSCADAPFGVADLVELRHRFDAQHRAMFGHMAPEEPVEVVSYRVRGIGLVPAVEMPRFTRTGAMLEAARRETRSVRFDSVEMDCPVYQREHIDVGTTVPGPAILDQYDCTTVLCPGQAARVDAYKNLIVRMGS
ncbi:MAG: hydantoinase/oxoprolinase family protein [Rhizobiales bacterium]|nr:hydantoinase/oxoprolinase family protein [Hyphomicrobiales bacterium]